MKKKIADSMIDAEGMQAPDYRAPGIASAESSPETEVWTLEDAFYVLCDAMAAHPVMEDNMALMNRLTEIRIWHVNGNREVPWQHMVQILPQVLGFPLVPDAIR